MSKTKGATVVFQGSPLRSVEIRSSLDFLPGASDMLKQEINDELVLMFSDYIPDMLYKLSLENNPDASVYERNLAELMIASKDRCDRTIVFSKDRRFPFLSDALLNSDSLKSVRMIRNSAQTLGLAQSPTGSGFDGDVINSPACLSGALIRARPVAEARQSTANSTSSTKSESNKASALLPQQQQQQLARKQRRVISLRKNFNAYSESRQSSLLKSSAALPLQSGEAPQSSGSSSNGNTRASSQAVTSINISSPLIPAASSSVTFASAPASILSKPNPRHYHRGSPITPDLYYPQHQYHDLAAIPSLDFHKHVSVTGNSKMNNNSNHTTKHNHYTYQLQHQRHAPQSPQPQQQPATTRSGSLNYYKTRTKNNVATPNQIFSQSSAMAAATATAERDVMIVGDDHFGKTGEPFYNVGSVSFNIPPPVYR
jgi:hypothetical protein